MRLIILLFFLISSFISAQEEKKRNGLKNLLKQAEKLAKDLGLDDKIKDVIDAYGFYWDTNNLDGYLSLFTDSAKGVVINVDGSVDNYYIKSDEQIENNKSRMDYFIKNQMQRRHMMANSFFIELTNDYAHLRQYMILMTTNKKEKTEILTPVNYVFKLIKLNGIWKIIYREINLDKPLDLSL